LRQNNNPGVVVVVRFATVLRRWNIECTGTGGCWWGTVVEQVKEPEEKVGMMVLLVPAVMLQSGGGCGKAKVARFLEMEDAGRPGKNYWVDPSDFHT
jgi:hypothetical protein